MDPHGINNFRFENDAMERFRSLFQQFGNNLDTELMVALENADHMPSRGQICETAVREYLVDTLGSRYTVGNGFAFDIHGKSSKQQDVIIFDNYWSIQLTPSTLGKPLYIPAESVYATMEVKTTLSSDELKSALENIRSLKQLQREPVTTDYIASNRFLGFMSKSEDPRSILNPYFCAIFAFQGGRSIESIHNQLLKELQNTPIDEWPDLILVHNEGVILPYCTVCGSTANSINSVSQIGHSPSYKIDKLGRAYSLLGFHLLLAHTLHNLTLKTPNFQQMYGKLSQVSQYFEFLKNSRNDK